MTQKPMPSGPQERPGESLPVICGGNRLIGVEGVNLEPLKQKCKSHLAVSRFQQMPPLSL